MIDACNAGDRALAALEYAAAQAAMPAQPVLRPGADAATSLAPQAATADALLPESSLPMAVGSAAAQSMHYPSVADLERAGDASGASALSLLRHGLHMSWHVSAMPQAVWMVCEEL